MALQTTIPALADAQPVDANRRARNRERFELELEVSHGSSKMRLIVDPFLTKGRV